MPCNDQLEAYLRSLGADEVRHSGRTLLKHLKGTRDILRAWGCRVEVQYAGLFHSIFGTKVFKSALLSPAWHDDLEPLIGSGAALLVRLFAVSPRGVDLLDAWPLGDMPGLDEFDSETSMDYQLSRREAIADLITIECANLLDQRSGYAFIAECVRRLSDGSLELPGHMPERLRAINDARRALSVAIYR